MSRSRDPDFDLSYEVVESTNAKMCLTQMCLTFIFKVKHQGQVTDFKFSEILDLANVRIYTKIKSVACIQPEMRKVIQLICVTLSSKVNRQGHVIFFNIFDIPDLENVRIDTKIKSVACIQPEMRKVIQLMCDLEFQGQPSRSRDFFQHIWYPRPRKC